MSVGEWLALETPDTLTPRSTCIITDAHGNLLLYTPSTERGEW